MNLLGYVRVSTDDQARDGHSLADQTERVHAYCKAKGWTLVDVITDDGVSGKVAWKVRGLGTAFERAKSCEAGTPAGILALSLDRLSRDLRDQLDLFDACAKASIEVVTIQEGLDTSTPAGRCVLAVLGAFNQFTRESTAARVKATLGHLKAQGRRYGTVPYGMRVTEAGRLLEDPVEVWAVGCVRSWVRRGFGARMIHNHLLAISIADHLGVGVNPRTGRRWTLGTVQNLLRRVRQEAQ